MGGWAFQEGSQIHFGRTGHWIWEVDPRIFRGMDYKNRAEFLLFRLLLQLLRHSSPDAASDLLGRLGVWLGSVPRYRRRVVLQQLGMVFPGVPEQDLNVLADRVYEHLGRTVAEAFGPGVDSLAAAVEVEPDWRPLDDALARGRGVIVATGHIGNFELGGLLLASRYRLLDVVKSQRNSLFDRFINDLRARRGILTVPMESSGPVVLRHLRAGGVVSLLLDQDAGAEGLEVDFLGHKASTWPGVARLSMRTGCPVVPMAILRQGRGRHRLVISDSLDPGAGMTVQGFLQEISRAVEAFIRENPEQWFWVHRRWKYRLSARTEG